MSNGIRYNAVGLLTELGISVSIITFKMALPSPCVYDNYQFIKGGQSVQCCSMDFITFIKTRVLL
jgi:hypothetical protein